VTVLVCRARSPGTDPNVAHAPRRPINLSEEERERAINNVLRYFPAHQHAALAPELAEELQTLGHVYCHRLRPVKYPMRAAPIGAYPAKSQQAASIMLMIMNNLDPAVAQFPHELVTYGGNGSVFSNWAQYALTMRYLSEMSDEQTLVLYSGHPLGLFPSHADAPRMVITNGMVIPNYSSREMYEKMYALGVTQYGQMTAGSYCYIGPQGIVHGTTITILSAARKYLAHTTTPSIASEAAAVATTARSRLGGVVYLSSGLGGMSGAQPKAAKIAGCVGVIAEIDGTALRKRHEQGWVDEVITDVHACVERMRRARTGRECVSIGFHGNVVSLWEALVDTDDLLVDLGSDQTSLHNPHLGGYYPVQLTFEESREMMRSAPARFKQLVRESLCRHVAAINRLVARGMRFWDYGNAFLIEAFRAGADIMVPGSAAPDQGGKFRYPSYVQDIMGDIFSLGFGPFRWVCTSGSAADLEATDAIAADVFRELMANARPEAIEQYSDNLQWIVEAASHKLVVGSQARILYSNCEGRTALAKAFNLAIRSGRISAPVVLSRDHHDVSGTDSPYRETSNVYDGSAFTADMSVQNVIGDAARGATWVSLHNGGGVGWGEVINGGFGLTLDGSDDAGRRADGMLAWDVSNGLARRSWAGNANARATVQDEMARQPGLVVTIPTAADPTLVRQAAREHGDGDARADTGTGTAGGAAARPGALAVPCAPQALELVLVNCDVATMVEGSTVPYGLVRDAAIGIDPQGRITFVGARSDHSAQVEAARAGGVTVRDLKGALVAPGLVDCHTHLVYGGGEERTLEWECKLAGTSYADLAKKGGGIVATMAATRAASATQMAEGAAARLESLMRDGVTSLEIKSGYGLDGPTERRQLEAATLAAKAHGLKLARTYLGAHAVPPEYASCPDAYIDEVVLPTMEALHADGLIDAVDAFCESIAFSSEQTARIFAHAASLGLPLRLHGDQLSDMGCGSLAAEHRALSCDHCEHTSEEGVRAMARTGVVAVLLPACSVFMNEATLPPVAAFRKEGVRMAIATNCNPGSSPCASLLLAMQLACSRFRLSAEEAFAGVTRHAAAALGRQGSVGTLEVGKAADLTCWACTSPAELAYHMGLNLLVTSFIDGVEVQQPWPSRLSVRSADSAPPLAVASAPPSVPVPVPVVDEDRRLRSLIVRVDAGAPCPAAEPTKASIALIGFPFDEGCVRNGGRRGACEGPAAFRAALYKIGTTPDPVSGVDLAEHIAVVDLGDVAAAGASLEEAHAALRARVAEACRRGHTPWIVGGGNDQSYPNVSGLMDALALDNGSSSATALGGVINIDAHLDVRTLIDGRAHSGTPFWQMLEDARFRSAGAKFIEFGAQPMQCAAAHAAYVRGCGGEIVWHAERVDVPQAFAQALRQLGAPAFVSFDVDSIRAADMPAVSCPSPIGLSAADALDMCALAGASPGVRLVDMSEFNPAVVSQGEAYRAAKLCAFMFYRFALARAEWCAAQGAAKQV